MRKARSVSFSVKRQRGPVGLARLLVAAEPAQEVGLGRRQVAVAGEPAVALQRLDLLQRSLGAGHHRHHHRAVQRHHRRRPDAQQRVVEHQQLRPIRLLVGRRLGVQRGDRGLQREAARRPRPQRGHDQPVGLGDLRRVPRQAVLLAQPQQPPAASTRVEARAACTSSSASSPATSRSSGSSACSMRARSSARSATSTRTSASPDGAVCAVVDSRCTTVSTASSALGEFLGARLGVRNPGRSDLLLRPRDPRRHRRL